MFSGGTENRDGAHSRAYRCSVDSVIALYLQSAASALLAWAAAAGSAPSPLLAREQIDELCLPLRDIAADYLRDQLWEVFIERVTVPRAEELLAQ